jgi:hypothetical protein
MSGVPLDARDAVERSIASDNFKPRGRSQAGEEFLLIETLGKYWIAVVEVSDAVLVKAVYETSHDDVDRLVADLKSLLTTPSAPTARP